MPLRLYDGISIKPKPCLLHPCRRFLKNKKSACIHPDTLKNRIRKLPEDNYETYNKSISVFLKKRNCFQYIREENKIATGNDVLQQGSTVVFPAFLSPRAIDSTVWIIFVRQKLYASVVFELRYIPCIALL